MTRAIDRLIVCGYDGERKRPQGCWYDLVFDALAAIAVVSEPTNGTGVRFGASAVIGRLRSARPALPPRRPPRRRGLPGSIAMPAPKSGGSCRCRPPAPTTRRPRCTQAAWSPRGVARGSATHRLLQSARYPAGDPAWAGQSQPRARAGARCEERETVVDQVLRFWRSALCRVVQPGSQAEVPIVGRLTLQGRTVRCRASGPLVATAEAVLIADYKTNRPALRESKTCAGLRGPARTLPRRVAKLYPDRAVRLPWSGRCA